MSLTVVDQGLLGQYAQYTGFKNRLINGQMQIDQRNAGASLQMVNSFMQAFGADRWQTKAFGSGYPTNICTVQQVADAPDGFSYSMRVTASSASSFTNNGTQLGAWVQQEIEANNISDFIVGNGLCAFTIGFWVKASKTGVLSVSVENVTGTTGSYCTTVNINSATIWEYKTITIPAQSSYKFTLGNGSGLGLKFGLASNQVWLVNTLNQWNNGSTNRGVLAATQTNFLAATNDYIQFTGVQLEKGSTATSFDYRPYGTELALCQRYYEHTYSQGVAAGTATEIGVAWIGSDLGAAATTGTLQSQGVRFEVTKRTAPTITTWDFLGNVGKATRYYVGSGPNSNNTCTTDLISTNSFRVFVGGTSTTSNGAFHYAANAEL